MIKEMLFNSLLCPVLPPAERSDKAQFIRIALQRQISLQYKPNYFMNFFCLKVFFNISQADKPRELLVEAS